MNATDRGTLQLDLMARLRDNLDKNFWLEDQLRKAHAQASDLGPLFNEAFTATWLAEKLCVTAEYNSGPFWKELCLAVIENYVPACKARGTPGRPARETTRSMLIFGRLERIKEEFGISTHKAARRYTKRISDDDLKVSTLKTYHATFIPDSIKPMRLVLSADIIDDDEIRQMLIDDAIKVAIEQDGQNPPYLQD